MGRCTVFHGGCAVFWGGCTVFWGGCTVFQGRCAVFCCGTALTYKLCIMLLLDYFHPRNDGFVSCLPFTEHVQTLFTLNWACANSVLGMCRNNLHNLLCFWQFWLITMTETEHEHRLRLVDLTTSLCYLTNLSCAFFVSNVMMLSLKMINSFHFFNKSGPISSSATKLLNVT